MIYFKSPLFFLLIPLLILFIIYLKIKKNKAKSSLINFSQYIIFNGIKKSAKIKFYNIVNILNYIILLLFVVTLAGPQIGNKTEDVLNQGADIMIALDVSSSMEALDFKPVNRLEAAKKIAVNFVKSRKYDRVGVVLFSGFAFTQCPLTNDMETVTRLLGHATINMIAVDGTAIGSAIVTASNRLKDSQAKSKVIILITDGTNNIGEIDPITAAKIAQKLNIKIYAIGAGNPDGAYYQVMDPNEGMKLVKLQEQDLDETTLTQIAEITQGQYFRANNTTILKNIISKIDKTESTKTSSIKFTSYSEIFDKFILIIFILMLINIFFENILFRKLI